MPNGIVKEWVALQRKCLQLAEQNEYSRAHEEVDLFLRTHGSSELRSEILAFRGALKESEGKLSAARMDFLAARAVSIPATYQKYALELNIARLSLLLGSPEESESWFLEALETVVQDPLTSGSAAILGLMKLKGVQSLSPRETLLCETAVRQAWILFSLPGEPDLQDLPETVHLLREASARPLPSTGAG
jgi:hypothetical protein